MCLSNVDTVYFFVDGSDGLDPATFLFFVLPPTTEPLQLVNTPFLELPRNDPTMALGHLDCKNRTMRKNKWVWKCRGVLPPTGRENSGKVNG